MLAALAGLDAAGLEVVQLKNKFAHPSPLGYRDLNLNVRVSIGGRSHLAEVQLNLRRIADAKRTAHEQYEIIRGDLPAMCAGTDVDPSALEAFVACRLRSSALDAAVTALERKAGGLMLYARLIADQLEATTGKLDFSRVGALPDGLDETYSENFRRCFSDDYAAWSRALPLVELVCAAAEPLSVGAAARALGWDRDRCARACADMSLLFPLRDGEVIGVLHKTVTDWLTGEAPFDGRDAGAPFFVDLAAAHGRLARACGAAVRRELPATHASDRAADAALETFLGDGDGAAPAEYAIRWSLLHLTRSGATREAATVACALSFVRRRVDAGDVVAFAADLDALRGQDPLLLRDALVLSRPALEMGANLVEQLWQRLSPRATAETSPAARRLADDAKRVARELPLSAERPLLTAAGGAERCRIETGDYVWALASFSDPATGAPRLASGSQDKTVRVWDCLLYTSDAADE